MASGKIPVTELDRALIALGKSKSALPTFLRELGAGELWFLTPYHPEVIGSTVEIENGMRSPFCELEDAHGRYVPVFSSFERLREALKAGGVAENTYAAASMEAVLLLEILAKLETRGVLNKGCKTGSLILPLDMMRDVADGSAFLPVAQTGPLVSQVLNVIDPAEYPTDLLQPVFEILKQHPEFRAAWVLEHPDSDSGAAAGRHFQFMIQMEPRDAAIYHDFNMVLATTALATSNRADSGFVDETDHEYLANLWRQVPPFYIAPGHRRPSGGKSA